MPSDDLVLEAFQTRLALSRTANPGGIGLTIVDARPVWGQAVRNLPVASVYTTGFGNRNENRVSRNAVYGQTLSVNLVVFAKNDLQMRREFLPALRKLWEEFTTMIVSNEEILIGWGNATTPEINPDMDPSMYYRIVQPVQFLWDNA